MAASPCGRSLLADEPGGADAASEAVAEQTSLEATINGLIRQLDAESFARREESMRQLEELVSNPGSASSARALIESALLSPAISYEVRSRLRELRQQLPDADTTNEPSIVPTPSEQEARRLIAGAMSDSFAERQGATLRIRWLLDRPEWIVPLLVELERQLDDRRLDEADRRLVRQLWQSAQGQWLRIHPPGELPAITPADLQRWIDDLAGGPPTDQLSDARESFVRARRKLLGSLARDDTLPIVSDLLKRALANPATGAEAIRHIEQLLAWTQPAMVAEYWQADGRHANGQPKARHLGIQHLLIGVPSLPAGAERPSHFDSIDERQAHCVSGNSLTPGDWPVGVAFPHPTQEEAFFHLVNLPTPRRRLAYEHEVEIEESLRLDSLSKRTVKRVLDAKRRLSRRELEMLELLDISVVSQFAPLYFQQIDDAPLEPGDAIPKVVGDMPAGTLSQHGTLCHVLAAYGTQAAVPGLMEAVAAQRFLAPTLDAPYDLPWIAALAIARRDPWSEVDAWLAEQIPQTRQLRIVGDGSPELGAAAAAILAERHGTRATDFGMTPVADSYLDGLGCPAFRFVDEQRRSDVLAWWANHTSDGPARTTASRFDTP